ncbi:MAG: hypothetical protein ACYTGP_09330, partial [Planctomycetota bacterium]
TPWQGETDGDVDDTYPTVIAGIVYLTGNLQMGNNDSIITEGVIIAGGAVIGGSATSVLQVTYRDSFRLDPPPGFRILGTGPPRVATGSVEQVVD